MERYTSIEQFWLEGLIADSIGICFIQDGEKERLPPIH